MYAVVVTEASDLAGRPGYGKSRVTFRSHAEGTGQHYPARALGQELGETVSAYLVELSLHSPRWAGWKTLGLLELTPHGPGLGCGVEKL